MNDRTPSHETDVAELLRLAGTGDELAWRSIIDRYARRVFAMVRSHTRSEDLAEEITQSVFVTLAEQIGSGRYDERGTFEPFLFRITMNRVRDDARKRKARGISLAPEFAAEAAAAPSQTPEADPGELLALREAMNGLGDADRQIIELRHHGGLSFKHIADLLREPMGTVLARHHRALRKLRDAIEQLSDRTDDGHTPAGVSS
ncbi:MAG: sigma-70 family RNA polymerase sigma factor [Planctomycetota bacterium]